MEPYNPVIARLIEWGRKREDIRAIVMSSSRTNPTVQHLVDPLSDYDLDIIIDADARSWYEDRSWLEDFGKVLVGFVEPPAREYGIEIFGRVIIYADGTKIDYTVMPVDIFRQVVAEPNLRGGWDDGHQVLLDKDGMAAGLQAPTHKEFIPGPPSEAEYQETIERFFTETTYVGPGLEDNWDALFRTIAFYRNVAGDVGDRLGYAYPYELDGRVVQYLEGIKALKR